MFWTIAAVLLILCLLVLQHARGRRQIHVLVVVALMVIVFNRRHNLKAHPICRPLGRVGYASPVG